MNVPRLLLAAGVALSVSGAWAQLATHSPFLPVPGSAAAASTEASLIELRGVMALGNVVQYYIYDTAKGKGTWVKPEEQGNGFVIKGQNSTKESVTVEQGGRTFNLPMREAKVASSGQAVMPLPVPAAPGGPNLVTQSVVLSPTPADEQKRLDDVAAEVRRRRALRDAQGPAQPSAQAPAPAPNAPMQSGAAQNSNLRRGQ